MRVLWVRCESCEAIRFLMNVGSPWFCVPLFSFEHPALQTSLQGPEAPALCTRSVCRSHRADQLPSLGRRHPQSRSSVSENRLSCDTVNRHQQGVCPQASDGIAPSAQSPLKHTVSMENNHQCPLQGTSWLWLVSQLIGN